MESRYITSVTSNKQLKSFNCPEIAFIGRSNSGKSSLINALLGRKKLAQTSSTPGRTRMINFYAWKHQEAKEIIIADLPGFGYQKTPHHIVKGWNELISSYFERDEVQLGIHTIDIRRDLKQEDWSFFQFLHEKKNTPLWVMLTKCDKINTKQRLQALQHARNYINSQFSSPVLISATSAAKHYPMDLLRTLLKLLTEFLSSNHNTESRNLYLDKVHQHIQQHDRDKLKTSSIPFKL